MSRSVFGPKGLRKLSRNTGMNAEFAWSRGGSNHTVEFKVFGDDTVWRACQSNEPFKTKHRWTAGDGGKFSILLDVDAKRPVASAHELFGLILAHNNPTIND